MHAKASSKIIAVPEESPLNPSIKLKEFIRPLMQKSVNKIEKIGIANARFKKLIPTSVIE